MKIIANHAHLMPPVVPGGWWPPGDATVLLKHLDACGIERTVVFPPFAKQMDNNMAEANRWALREVRAHADRFIPAGTVFPLAPDIMEVLQFLHDEGVRWLKIHPSVDLYDIADPAAEPFYAKASELGMILDYHTGPHRTRLSLAKPEKFDDVACSHPELKLVFEHLGGRVYVEEFLAILGNHREQTYGGLTSIFDSSENYLWYLTPERIEEIVKGIGARKFIFGLDFPWNSIEATKKHIQVINSLDIPDSDKELIFGGNISRLLNL